MANGTLINLCKTIGVVGGAFVGSGLIFTILWTLFAQQKVTGEIDTAWQKQKPAIVKIADSVTQSYTDDLYEKNTRMYFAQQAMLTPAQKRKAEADYEEYIKNIRHR